MHVQMFIAALCLLGYVGEATSSFSPGVLQVQWACWGVVSLERIIYCLMPVSSSFRRAFVTSYHVHLLPVSVRMGCRQNRPGKHHHHSRGKE